MHHVTILREELTCRTVYVLLTYVFGMFLQGMMPGPTESIQARVRRFGKAATMSEGTSDPNIFTLVWLWLGFVCLLSVLPIFWKSRWND